MAEKLTSVTMFQREELAWAAGFFDGEGCFSATPSKKGAIPQPVTAINQIHPFVQERFRDAVRVGIVRGPHKKPGNRSPQWSYRVSGFEASQYVLAVLWRWLSPVKREQGTRILDAFRREWLQRAEDRRAATLAKEVAPRKEYATTHCGNGHEFTERNTGWSYNPKSRKMYRRCRKCAAEGTRRHYRKKFGRPEKGEGFRYKSARMLELRSGDFAP